jgi:H/ACA ribonucleoprotein complex subunit 4
MEEKFPFERIQRKVLVKSEVETDKKYGCDPNKRPLNELITYGIVNINKTQGPTSHQVTDYVKKILNLKHAGHSGTLDPNVTGSLIIALEDATRVVQNLLKAGKEYVCLMHLHNNVDEFKLKQTINSFVTKIEQLPPRRSAVKRQLRQREIYYITILEIKEHDVLFKVGCEAGTYIRKLCYDIGEKLKIGASMTQLIRTRVGPFDESTMCTLYELKDAFEAKDEKKLRNIIQPMESAVKHLPKIWIYDEAVDSVCHGSVLAIPGISKLESGIKENDLVAVLTLKNELVCTGNSSKSSEDIMKDKKGIALKPSKVYMNRNVYPKYKRNV